MFLSHRFYARIVNITWGVCSMIESFLNNVLVKKRIYFAIISLLLLWFICTNPDVAIMIFASAVFACSLSPLVDKLSAKMSRTIAATLVLSGVIIAFVIFLIPVLVVVAQQVNSFSHAFPQYIADLDNTVRNTQFLQNIGISKFDTDAVASSFATSSTDILGSVADFIANMGSAFLYIFTSVIFIFFFLTDKERVKSNFVRLFPSEMREKTNTMLVTIARKLGGYVIAQVFVSGSVWVTMTLGLLALQVQYALILGVIAGVLSIIPVVGSGISLLICLVATYTAGWKVMVLVTILFTVSHFIENHVVRPYFYSKFLSLHPIIVFLALFLGAKYAGVIGVIFAPPFLMALCLLLEELYMKKMDVNS